MKFIFILLISISITVILLNLAKAVEVSKRSVKDVVRNCKTFTHTGQCLNNGEVQSGNLIREFNKRKVKPKPYQPAKMVETEEKSVSWWNKYFG